MFVDEIWDSTLGELANVQIGPFGSLLHKEDYVEGGVAVLNPMHIQDGRLIPDPKFSVSQEKANELGVYQIQRGDVIVGCRGEMGRAGIADERHVGMMCGTGSLNQLQHRLVILGDTTAFQPVW